MSTYEISKSSLVSLKAEILRKHQELLNFKSENERKIEVLKKNTPLEFKNKKVNKDGKDVSNDIGEPEESQDLLRASRLILEQKSALYEKLRSGKGTNEQRKHFLVRFDKMNECIPEFDDEPDKYPESDVEIELSEEEDEDDNIDPSEKWVDYVDCLGRTRKCMQKDLAHLKSKDEELRKIVEAKKRNIENDTEKDTTFENKTTDCDAVNTNSIKTSEESESELLSSDMRRQLLREQWEKEEERLRDKSDVHYQDVLFGEARTHGVGYYGFSKNEDERLKQQEALKQLREETEQKQKRAQELKSMRDKQLAARIKAAKERRRARLGLPPEEEIEPEASSDEPKISEEDKQKQLELDRQKEEKEKILEEARKRHLRPWDEGKEGVSTERYVMTQEEWSELKRSERDAEFAPPTSFKKDHKNRKDDGQRKKEKKQISKKLESRKYTNPYKNCGTEVDDDVSAHASTAPKYSSTARGAEIPPPLHFDYFGPSSSKVPRKSSEKNDINESIEAGLMFLKKQMEQKQRKRDNVEFIDC